MFILTQQNTLLIKCFNINPIYFQKQNQKQNKYIAACIDNDYF